MLVQEPQRDLLLVSKVFWGLGVIDINMVCAQILA
jgi:hypothetical protein